MLRDFQNNKFKIKYNFTRFANFTNFKIIVNV